MYDKIIKFIKEEYKFLIFACIVLFLGFFHLPYNIYVGGGTINLENRLEVENEKKLSGSFNLSYVKTVHATIPTYLLSYVFDWERENINDTKIDENDNIDDIWTREQLYLQEANDNAIISAYRTSNSKINIKKEILKVLYIDKNGKTDLKIGDILLSVNNVPLKEFSDIKEIINDFNVGDKINVTYKRNDKEYNGYFILQNIGNEKKAGLYLIKLFDYDVEKKVKLKFNDSEGGPSGGFMTALAIYSKLTGDITNGMKIVGTGTIDSDGNVGKIGGVTYKLKGAVNDKAAIFFVPEANYEEALKYKNEKGYDIKLIKVKTLMDAIDYLEKR